MRNLIVKSIFCYASLAHGQGRGLGGEGDEIYSGLYDSYYYDDRDANNAYAGYAGYYAGDYYSTMSAYDSTYSVENATDEAYQLDEEAEALGQDDGEEDENTDDEDDVAEKAAAAAYQSVPIPDNLDDGVDNEDWLDGDGPDYSVDYNGEYYKEADDSGVVSISEKVASPDEEDAQNELEPDEIGYQDEDEWETDYSQEYPGDIDDAAEVYGDNILEIDSVLAAADMPIDKTITNVQFNSAGSTGLAEAMSDQLDTEDFPNQQVYFDKNDKGVFPWVYVSNEDKLQKETYQPTPDAIATCTDSPDMESNSICLVKSARKFNRRQGRCKGKCNNKTKGKGAIFKGGWQAVAQQMKSSFGETQGFKNCGRGYQADNKMCGNALRANFIANGGRGSDKTKLYTNNKGYVKTEACLELAGLAKPAFLHKNLANMKGRTPVFCKKDQKSCINKELKFAACVDLAVCQLDCWSENSSEAKCQACQRNWCRSPTMKKMFNVCSSRFSSCSNKFKPDYYQYVNATVQLEGKLECWGFSPGTPKKTYLDIPETLSAKQSCERAKKYPSPYPFSEYIQYYQACKEKVCDLDPDNMDGDFNACVDISETYHAVTSNGVSREWIDIGICRHCPIENMALTGRYDRKIFGGEVNPIIEELGLTTTDTLYRQPIEPMTLHVASLLPEKTGCKYCDLMYERVTCRDMCGKMMDYIQAGTDMNDRYFKWAHSVCKAARCTVHLRTACNSCMKKAQRPEYARLQWSTSLGVSEFNNNVNGWGCAKDCVAYKASILGEYNHVSDVKEQWSSKVQAALDLMSNDDLVEFEEDTWEAITEWANSAGI